ncbi:MAG: cache domain-containing protein, partial [Gammaproteobacteria bacterium]|nr:cache domain-containing protein [Gammaproteobacteria bacterium]
MTFSLRLLYIAVFQVILTAVITYFLVTDEYRKLSNESLRTLEHFLKEQKQQELKNYTSLAISTVENIYQHGDQRTNVIKLQVANMLGSLLYNGEDGYFFVYDDKGIGISHPKEPFRVGKNWWDLEDKKGEKIIQILINNAK